MGFQDLNVSKQILMALEEAGSRTRLLFRKKYFQSVAPGGI